MTAAVLVLAEDPSESYVKLRDFVLVKLCQSLPSFTPEQLSQGFSDAMATEAREKLKINKVRAHTHANRAAPESHLE